MESAHLANLPMTRADPEVVGVAEQYLYSGLAHLGGDKTLDRTLGSDGHKRRGLNVPVGCRKKPRSGRTTCLVDRKPQDARGLPRSINIASP